MPSSCTTLLAPVPTLSVAAVPKPSAVLAPVAFVAPVPPLATGTGKDIDAADAAAADALFDADAALELAALALDVAEDAEDADDAADEAAADADAEAELACPDELFSLTSAAAALA